ncbi:ATP/GTP-binding protein [Synechococcus sp. CS-1328]|uniref:AAA family ATPase n=1 Tax=Synechococcus sp. CS-1328 TaxID=2847976 RepID=UPI00223A960F|nr:ATP-binding protein [Synechococcus sp. CS-1328]MCT0225603.1 ATP-binding protein [Synechococcus sp. CS-1328]
MVSSEAIKETSESQSIHRIDRFGIKGVLRSAAIFGANGSGKSNLVLSLRALKGLVLGSLESIAIAPIRTITPFLLKTDHYDTPTEFEVSILAEDNLYRYGISIRDDEIEEEWLYWNKTTARETMLFHRTKKTINFNARSFSEAKSFVKRDGDIWSIEKTKPQVPFLSVLSQFDGERSSVVTRWFERLKIISGIQERYFRDYTYMLFEKNPDFKAWALKILKSLQIKDVSIVERAAELPAYAKEIEDKELQDAFSGLKRYLEKNKIKEEEVVVTKVTTDGESISLPLDIESEGTVKLICLLGPLYDAITSNVILVVDEFDNRFHALMSRFIIELYSKQSLGQSQIILTCHDTNLLTGDLFRRDQIWFVEKDSSHESKIFSLAEYVEHFTQGGQSYSRNYLLGEYGAIPLFSSISALGEFHNDK